MSRNDTINNAAQLVRFGLAPADVAEIMSISRSLKRIAERQCNGYASTDWGREAESRDERRERSLLNKACQIAARAECPNGTGAMVYHQGDPRGCALYLYNAAQLREYNERDAQRPPIEIDACYSSIGVAVYG